MPWLRGEFFIRSFGWWPLLTLSLGATGGTDDGGASAQDVAPFPGHGRPGHRMGRPRSARNQHSLHRRHRAWDSSWRYSSSGGPHGHPLDSQGPVRWVRASSHTVLDIQRLDGWDSPKISLLDTWPLGWCGFWTVYFVKIFILGPTSLSNKNWKFIDSWSVLCVCQQILLFTTLYTHSLTGKSIFTIESQEIYDEYNTVDT